MSLKHFQRVFKWWVLLKNQLEHISLALLFVQGAVFANNFYRVFLSHQFAVNIVQ